jgi:hypothetical protein
MHLMVIAEQPASSADAARLGPVVRAVLVVSGDPAVQAASGNQAVPVALGSQAVPVALVSRVALVE